MCISDEVRGSEWLGMKAYIDQFTRVMRVLISPLQQTHIASPCVDSFVTQVIELVLHSYSLLHKSLLIHVLSVMSDVRWILNQVSQYRSLGQACVCVWFLCDYTRSVSQLSILYHLNSYHIILSYCIDNYSQLWSSVNLSAIVQSLCYSCPHRSILSPQ